MPCPHASAVPAAHRLSPCSRCPALAPPGPPPAGCSEDSVPARLRVRAAPSCRRLGDRTLLSCGLGQSGDTCPLAGPSSRLAPAMPGRFGTPGPPDTSLRLGRLILGAVTLPPGPRPLYSSGPEGLLFVSGVPFLVPFSCGSSVSDVDRGGVCVGASLRTTVGLLEP